jgi:hypothetical protein
MKITLNIDEELEFVMQQHLETGVSVQTYIKLALKLYTELKKAEMKGFSIGYGNKDRFKQYNIELHTDDFI